MGDGFNKKMLRGARVLRVVDALRVAKLTLESQRKMNQEMGNEKTLLMIEGKIDGLDLALSLLTEEFGEQENE